VVINSSNDNKTIMVAWLKKILYEIGQDEFLKKHISCEQKLDIKANPKEKSIYYFKKF
jgi:hypothetical protein